MTDAHAEDACCGPHLDAALLASLTMELVDSWECPACGCRWKPRMEGPIRWWEPVPVVCVVPFRRRR